MSKKFRSFTIYLTLIICMLAGVFSCKNFMQGQEFAEEMDSVMKYVNSPKFTVYITPDDNVSGTLVSAGQKENCRVGDTISLEFKLADGYQFLGWKAVNKNDTSISYAECVTFKDATSTKTSVTLIKSNEAIVNSQLLIRPVCAPEIGLDLNSCAPKNTSVAAPACNDSTITLYFTNDMSTAIDERLDEIKIYCGEEDYTDYFLAPEHSEENPKIIRIPSNPSNHIPFESTTDLKELRVVIPADYTYVTEDGYKELGKEFSFSYVINYTTSAKTTINFEIGAVDDSGAAVNTSDELGSLRIDGQTGTAFSKEYNISESKQISFKIDSDYEFVGWVQSEGSEEYIGLSYPKDEYGEYLYTDVDGKALYFDEESQTAAVLVKVYNSASDITVTAVVRKIPSHSIKVSSSEGKISPNGTETYQKGAKIPLTFSSDSEYCFTYWQVLVDGKVNTKQKYITFENKDKAETTATFVKSPAANVSLTIEPVCEIRPVILSKSPEYTAAGVYRDARIKVMFDHPMDASSIYYTSAEQKNLKAKGYTLLKSDNQCYGYSNNGTVTYKNISIIDSKTKKSILDHFGAPVFETEDVLVIPSNREDPMSPGSQAIVEISSKLSYKVSAKYSIPLATSIKWNYFVNSKVDTDLPELSIKEFSAVGSKFDPATTPARNTGAKTAITAIKDETTAKTDADLYRIFAHGRKIYLGAEVTDNGSGAAGFSMEVYKQENDGTLTAKPTVDLGLILSGSTGSYGTYEGSQLKGDELYFDKKDYPEGIYRLHFIGSDQNSNFKHDGKELADGSFEKYYYYVYFKDSAPEFTNANVTKIDNEINSLTPTWTEPTEADFHSVEISYKLKSAPDTSYVLIDDIAKGTLNKKINSLVPGNLYELKISALNNYANSTTVTLEKYTRPKAVTNLTANRNSANPAKIDLKWDNPEISATKGNFDGLVVYYKTQETGASWKKYKELAPTKTSVTVDGLAIGTKYDFKVVTFTGELADGNTTDSIEVSKATQPGNATNLSASQGTNYITVYWSKPSTGSYSGCWIYKKDLSIAEPWDAGTEITSATKDNYKFESLIPGHEYEFNVVPYYDESTNLADKTIAVGHIKKYTKPKAITQFDKLTTKSTSSITLKWTNPEISVTNGNFDGLAVYYQKAGETNYTFFKQLTNDKDSITVTGLATGTKYKFKVDTFAGTDYSKNNSSKESKLKTTQPAGVTGLGEDPINKYQTYVTLKYTTPSALTGTYIYQKNITAGGTDFDWNNPITGTVDSKKITGLKPGNKYEFCVLPYITDDYETAVLADKTNTASKITVYTKPKAVTNITASTVSTSEIKVDWTNPDTSDGSSFNGIAVYYSKDGSDWKKFGDNLPNTSNTVTVTGLSIGTNYKFKVTTYAGAFTDGNTIEAESLTYTPTRPSGNVKLKVYQTSNGYIWVQWTNPSGTEGTSTGSYVYYRELPNGTWSTPYDKAKSTIQCTINADMSLSPSTQYEIKVLPYLGTTSNLADDNASYHIKQYTKPNPITGITATRNAANPGTAMDITWDTPSSTVTGLKLKYKEYGVDTDYTVHVMTDAEKTAKKCTVTGLSEGKKYEFAIDAYINKDTDSTTMTCPKANIATQVTRPNTVTNLSSTSSGTSITLKWTNPTAGDYDGIRVYRADVETNENASFVQYGSNLAKTDTTVTVTGNTPGHKYKFMVVPVYEGAEADNDAASSNIITYAVPSTVTEVSTVRDSSSPASAINVTWTNPAADSYDGVYVAYATSSTGTYTSCDALSKSATSYTITGLAKATKYWIRVYTYSGTSKSSTIVASYQTTGATQPNDISGLTVTSTTTASATLSWTKPSSGGVTGYNIYKKDLTAGDTTFTKVTYTTGTSATISLANVEGHQFEFKVLSYYIKDSNESADSAAHVTQYIKPNNVTSVSSTRTSTSEITISWTKPTGNFSGYKLYWGTSSTSLSLKASISDTATSYKVTGLTAGTKYYFTIYTYAGTWVSVTGLNNNVTSVNNGYTIPGTPTGVSIKQNSQSKINTSWTKPSAGSVTGYEIEQTNSSGTKNTYTSTTTSYTATGLTTASTYTYRIRAYYTVDSITLYSAWTSSYTGYTCPDVPSNFAAKINTSAPSSAITLTWTNNSSFSKVELYRGSTATSVTTLITSSTASNFKSYTNTGLSAKTPYYYKLRVYNETSYVETSTVTIYTGYAAPPAAPEIYNDDGLGCITLVFTAPSDTDVSAVYVYVDNTLKTTVSLTSSNRGTYVYPVVQVSDIIRDDSYDYAIAYAHTKNGAAKDGVGAKKAKSYTSTGEMKLDGKTYSYTTMKNACKTQKTIAQNTSDYHWSTSCSSSNHSGDANADEHSAFYGSGDVNITISNFSIAQFEVTQGLYYKIMGANPSKNNNSNTGTYPVDNVTWSDAILFCNKLSLKLGLTPYYKAKTSSSSTSYVTTWTAGTTLYSVTLNSTVSGYSSGYRLPTAAEWEFAARGGDPTAAKWKSYYSGASTTSGNKVTRNTVAWNTSNSNSTTHTPLDTKNTLASNGLGLYNMSGNVWEWVYGTPTWGGDATKVIQKGGGYTNNTNCNVMGSCLMGKGSTDTHSGFRICRSVNYD